LPLEIKPTKIGDSLYLLIPKALKDLFEISDDTRFTMLFEANGRRYRLIYLPERENAEWRSRKNEDSLE